MNDFPDANSDASLHNQILNAQQNNESEGAGETKKTTVPPPVNTATTVNQADKSQDNTTTNQASSSGTVIDPDNNNGLPEPAPPGAKPLTFDLKSVLNTGATTAEEEAWLAEYGVGYFGEDTIALVKLARKFGGTENIPKDYVPQPGELPEGVTVDELLRGELGPNIDSLSAFLDAIMKFTIAIRKMLNNLQSMTAGELKQNIDAKLSLMDAAKDMMDQVHKANQEMRANLAEQKAEQEAASRRAEQFKIIMIVVTVVVTAIACVATVLTCGLASPAMIALAVVLCTVTVAIAAVTIADTCMDGQLFGIAMQQAFADAIEYLTPDNVSDEVRFLVQALVVIAIIVIVIAIIVVTKSLATGLAGLGGAAASTASTAAALVTLTMVNALVTVLATSGVFQTAIKEMILTCTDDEQLAAILAAILGMLLLMFVSLGAAAFAMSGAAFGATNAGIHAATKAAETAEMAIGVAAGISNAIHEFAMERLKLKQAIKTEEIATLQEAIDIIKEILLKLLGLNEESLRGELDNLAQDVEEMTKQIPKALDSIKQAIEPIFTAL
ncbi:hypothetical protein SCG7086_AN_00180 [Chlamydiales bacterium SCGC AG-110-P3]|nr:hypothetical protein SCG7086_AN_00180 [Chlamydiales bacterium SCGC AG-110-P3]